jgi:cytochrome c oxidase assembly protein subunit 15
VKARPTDAPAEQPHITCCGRSRTPVHKYATLVAAATVVLIAAGGLVTSTGSGLAVPDWPTTYGWSMFTFPLSKMVGGIRYEHGHRLVASTVGFLTIILTAWLWLRETRVWVRWLGIAALVAVITQGVLGGITVLYFLPPAVSIAHAGLAQVFFCLTITLALVTSRGWMSGATPDDPVLRRIATTTTVMIYAQILLGAAMRHTGAGLAIEDFPQVFGGVLPPYWNGAIAVHFAHRVGAAIVALLVLATAAHVWFHHRRRRELVMPAIALTLLVLVQITLGGLTVLTRKDVIINTSHVVTGALVLASSLVLTLRTWRVRFAVQAADPRRAAIESGLEHSMRARA